VDNVPTDSLENHYCGSYQYGCKTRDKQGTDSTWLVDAISSGTVIITGFKVEKSVFVDNKSGKLKKNKCIGVVTKFLSESIKMALEIEAK
ncbi:hypothetical protein Ancab_013079, partial [Ancistrocladus abbreviatus]